MRALVRFNINDVIKAEYQSAPSYKQDIILKEVDYKWGDYIPEFNSTLAIEMSLRAVAEFLYIMHVENRGFTTDEKEGFDQALTYVHNRNAGVITPVIPNQWWQNYIDTTLGQSAYAKQQAMNDKAYITSL